MDIGSSIQDSTKRQPQGDSKSAGFINGDEAMMGALRIFMDQAEVIVRQEFKKQLEDKDKEITEKDKKIKELEALLAINQGKKIIPLSPAAPPMREYRYDHTLFPKDNGDVIIDCLIDLTKCKRENDRYVLVNKTDWLIMVKALSYFGVYIGDGDDFLCNILPNVLKYMDDAKRITQLSAKQRNFDTIDPYSPILTIPVDRWNKEARKERENITQLKREGKKTPNANNTTLNRCLNIKVNLRNILINHDVQLENY